MPECAPPVHHDIKKMTSLGLLAKNAAANLIQPGVGWLIVLVLSPILVRVMDKASYATWMLLLQIGAYFTMVDGTIQLSVTHFVSRARGTGDRRYMNCMLASAEVALLVLGALAICASFAFAWRIGFFFKDIPQAILAHASVAMLFIGCSIGAALPFSTLAGSFRAYQKNEIPAIATMVGKAVGAFGIGWEAYHHAGLARMAVWWAVGNLVSPAILLLFWARWRDRGTIQVSNLTGKATREFLGFGGTFLVSQLCGILITGLDMPIVAAFAFPAAAYYAVATTVANMLTVPQIAITGVVFPVTSAMSGNSTPERMGAALVKFSRFGTAIQLLLTLPLLAGMSMFLRVWVGPEYAKYSLPLAIVLVLSHFVRTSLRPFAMVCLSAGQQVQILLSPIAEGIVNLAVSLALVHSLGAIGVAWGTLVGAFVSVLVHLFVSMRLVSAVKVRPSELVMRGILRPIVCVLPAVALFCGAAWAGLPTGAHVLAIFAGEALAAAGLFLGSCNPAERSQFLAAGRRMAKVTTG